MTFKISRALAVISSGAVVATGLVSLRLVAADAEGPRAIYKVDIVGDSYSAGEGMTDTYFDPKDPRHRSPYAAGAQAAQRVQDANPNVELDVSMAASSGATTKDIFKPQLGAVQSNRNVKAGGPKQKEINGDPQLSLIRPDADAIIVGLGGNDARFTQVLTDAITSVTGAAFDKLLGELEKELDAGLSVDEYQMQAAEFGNQLASGLSEEDYLKQAKAQGESREKPTIAAKLLYVYQALKLRAPHAKLVVPNYPMAIDPKVKAPFYSGFSKDEMQRLQDFGKKLNAAIAKAAEVCACGVESADVSKSVTGREVYTDKPALTDLGVMFTGESAKWSSQEPFHPNTRGGALMAGPISKALAKKLELKEPPARGAELTPFKKLKQATR